MSLPDFSVRRPVATIMIFAAVILFGVISLFKLPQELFPPIEYPQLTIFTSYANAAPQEIETLLTKPIEESVGTVSGLRAIRSISREGLSLVFAEFGWDQNMDFASLRVREKVDLIKAQLPRDSSEPLVVPVNPFELPVMRLSITGARNLMQVRRIAVDTIKQELEKVEGVASATVEGGLEREILVDVDQSKLYNHKIPILDVSDSITNSNLNYPAGTIKESFYEYLIRTLGEFQSVEEIKNVVVKSDQDNRRENMAFDEKLKARDMSKRPDLVQIKDLALVLDTAKEISSYSRFNGTDNVSITIQKQSKTNTLSVIENIKKSFPAIRKKLPDDIRIDVAYDQSLFIIDSINGVRDTAIEGGVLSFVVLLVFLRDMISSVIVTLSIPISVMIAFTLMFFGGITINMMSLMGLAMAVGLLVDDGIVVIENIFRHREKGQVPQTAAVEGSNEVFVPVLASTLTTVFVFIPIVFVVGIAGQFFKELAFSVTFSLLGSFWVAMSLTPLLSYKLTPKNMNMEIFEGGKTWKNIVVKYSEVLKRSLKYKGFVLLGVLILLACSCLLIGVLEKELMPKADQGEFIIKLDMPVGTVVGETNRVALLVEEEVNKYKKEIKTLSTVVGSSKGTSAKDIVKSLGSHQSQIIVVLEEDRDMKTMRIVTELGKIFKEDRFKPAKIEVLMQQSIMSGAFAGGGKPITIEIKGSELKTMDSLAEVVKSKLQGIKGVFGIEDDLAEPSPEIKITIDKDKAALYNLSVVDLAKVAQIILKGYVPSQFKEKGKEVDIRVVVQKKDRDTFAKLYQILVNSPVAGNVPLSTVAKFEKTIGPSEIRRISQEKTITVSANVGTSRKTADVLGDVANMIKTIKPESGYRVQLAGETEEMKSSFDSLRFALILAILLVYMIMAAEFESLVQPFIILFTVPLSIIGVLWSLYVTSTSINIVSLLGVIMLGGIVVKNGIIMIDFTNILLSKGVPPNEAIVEACRVRLRPIIMTALTAILGLIPMAIAGGRGSELRAPMAISVMGGLLVSTFLTLVIIPSIFLLEIEVREKLGRSARRLGAFVKDTAGRIIKKMDTGPETEE
ncbi:MAG: efflux RND transporter permease subunit [Candidatus Omnitrophica bacterium]|nr:efflux RND transporter permease subunit [Candidatus Omnitrophota bacterium]